MTLAYPWSGFHMAPAASATGMMGGGAATPVSRGAGFNWRSMVRYTAGLPPGLRGLRGLGGCSTDETGVTVCVPDTTPTASSTSQAPWYAPLIGQALSVGGQITNYELNPLLGKQTYVSTPQGLVYATNYPTSGIPGVTSIGTANLGSFLPILLIGGIVMMMAMGRR